MSLADAALVERIGIVLLHSLWESSLVGAGLFAALVALRGAAAQARYVAACLALSLLLLFPAVTFMLAGVPPNSAQREEAPPSRLATSAAAALEVAASLLPEELPRAGQTVAGDLPAADNDKLPTYKRRPRWLSANAEALLFALVAGWSGGVVLLCCRLLGGHLLLWRLRRHLVEPLEEIWQGRVRRLATRLNVRAPIELWQSANIEAPLVIGCFRPAILLPISMLAGLTPAQVEAILAHELAHVRRHDFLVNAVQCVVEIVLFYHPCTWWISARIRAEREHCCDEIAAESCGDALAYARALTRLEEQRPPNRLALALTGGSLLVRVRRIVGQRRASDVVGGWIAGALAIGLPLAVGAAWASNRSPPTSVGYGAVDGPHALEPAHERDLDAALFRDAVHLTNDLADTLSGVTSAASAAAAADKIVGLSRRHGDVNRRLRELRRSLDPQAEARLGNRWAKEIERASQRLAAEVARIEQLPGAVDALRSSVLFAVIGLHGAPSESPPAATETAFLLPANGRPFPRPVGDPLAQMLKDHGPEHVVEILVTGLRGDAYANVYEELRQTLPNLGYVGSGAGDTATVYVAPVSDLDHFASRIKLGRVTSIDRARRLITVAAHRPRLPGPQPQPQKVAAENQADPPELSEPASLGERLERRDPTAIADLVLLGAEGERIAAEYARRPDRRVRRAALLALKQMGARGSLDAAIGALADDDLGNRDLAWQIICRTPGAMQRGDVIEAAAAGLEQDGEQAAKWLAALGAEAESATIPYAEHRSPSVRRGAATALRSIGGPRSLLPLERLLDDTDAATAAMARKAYQAVTARQPAGD